MSLEKLPIKVITTIAKNCYIKNFNFENPYDDTNDSMKILKSATSWLGSEVSGNFSFEEMEFIARFMYLNLHMLTPWFNKERKFEQIANNLLIPKPKRFDVKYSVYGTGRVTEYMETTWDCYDEDWVESSMRESEMDGAFYWGDGHFLRTEVEDFEWEQIDYDKITPIKRNTNENFLSKIVLENNRETLDHLDRNTLIKLRDMINQKLSSI